jgi:acyl-CoA synthetase (AMP-forming)/AMP-acid ligase II
VPGSLLTDQLALMAAHLGDRTAFVDLGSGAAVTFGAWDRTANRLARGLLAAGVAPGDRVALDLPGTRVLDWVVAYAAIHKAGAVAVPLNTRLVAPEVRHLLAHAGVSAVLVADGTRDTVTEALATDDGGDALAVRMVVDLDADAAPFPLPVPAPGPDGPITLAWSALLDPDDTAVEVPVGDDDMADIVYTSGTTGRPKGVVVRHANASLLPNGVPAWTGQGWLTCSPLFTFAGITAVYNPMKLGMTALYLPRFDAGAWLEAVETHRPVMVFLVPAMAELLLAHPDFPTADLSSIGLCAVGSAPLAPDVQRRLQERMPAASVSNAYGMTEAGPAYTVLPKEEATRRVGSVGRPLPPAEFFAVDESGSRLGPDQIGELVIRLPGRPREYYCDPDASAAVWRSDGLHTGDLARVDADGYVYVVGRAKEVIIRGGNNVHAADVEAVLYEHPDVQEAVVAGVPHPVLGEDVAAWVVARPGSTIDPVDLWAFAAQRLADYKVPRRVALVDRLPRNATGKVVKAELTPPPLGAGARSGES